MSSNYCKKIYKWFVPSLIRPKETTTLGSGMWIGLFNYRSHGGTTRTYDLVDVTGTLSLEQAEKRFNQILVQKWHEQKPAWVV